MFKSATLDGRDVSEAPFDFQRDISDLVIPFTDRWSGVSGRSRARATTAHPSSSFRPFDPSVLERLAPAAVPVTIAGVEKKTIDLTVR